MVSLANIHSTSHLSHVRGPPKHNITEYADKVLRRQLESLNGVGQVIVTGGRERQVNIVLDADRLRAYNVTVTDVARALTAQNAEIPGGRMDQGEDGMADADSIANINGTRTVLLNIRRQSGTNTGAVVNGIKEQLKATAASLPAGYKLRIVRDGAEFIEASIHNVEEHLIVGSLLAAFVVMLFLMNVRAQIISAIASDVDWATFGVI
jgi:HAE1 family hydrophobic/amphiphilic exporter-1